MKRIFVIGMICVFSMFFTGCSLLTVAEGYGYERVKQDVIETSDDKASWSKVPLRESETLASKEIPEYYDINNKEKEESLKTAVRAFRIADGHSEKLQDIVSFDVVTMLSDGRFLYGYSTKKNNTTDTFVHCAAAYDYVSHTIQVIHTQEFLRRNIAEDKEEFDIQLCADKQGGTPLIFVYDNGSGYLYDLNGSLKYEVNILETIEAYFKTNATGTPAHDVSVTQALSDGNQRFYVELSIEKQEIGIEDTDLDGEKDIEEMSEEEAEREVDNKVIDVVLVYDLEELKSQNTLVQVNLAYDKQVKKWQEMTNNKEYKSEPNKQNDWNSVRSGKDTADQWSVVYMDSMDVDKKADEWLNTSNIDVSAVKSSGMPVLTWSGSASFSYSNNGYVCQFLPKAGSYKGFTDLKENTELSNVFIPLYGKYYEIHGKTGSYQYDEKETIKRSYTHVTYEDGKDESGNDIKIEVKTAKTQELQVYKKRYVTISNGTATGYLEGYGILESLGITDLNGAYNQQILCQKPEGTDEIKLYWLTQSWDLNAANVKASDISLISLTENGGALYYLISTNQSLMVVEAKYDSSKETWSSGKSYVISNDALLAEEMSVEGAANQEASSSGETTESTDPYAEAFESMGNNQVHWESITDKQILKTSIQSNASVLQDLSKEMENSSFYKVDGEGFLLATQQSGLIFYSINDKKTINLDAGTWYGTWKKGDKFVSVGFSKDDPYYNTNTSDIVYARVKEYELDDLYKEALEELLKKAKDENKRLAEEKEESRKASLEASSMAKENKESVEDMSDAWANYRTTTTAVDFESIMSEMTKEETTAAITEKK